MDNLPKIDYGKRNKNKGNSAERLYAIKFRELGFEKCRTSREGSKLYDDCAVDLLFLPILVQIKAGKQKGLNNSLILQEMKDRVAKEFPADSPEQTMPKVVIHHKDVGTGKVRTPYSQLVTMNFEDFTTLLIGYYNDLQNRKIKN
jgi:hypothetical protein